MADRQINALLFSDLKGFSRMSERDCLAFCSSFYKGVNESVLCDFRRHVLTQNTWGDALHVVVDDVVAAGRLALRLRDWTNTYDWKALGIAQKLQVRIGLHAGVVTKVPDPIIQAYNYVGKNTSKAARIEPITFEGQVFVSEPFAALLALRRGCGLACEYVGVRELHKTGGSIRVYMLRHDLGAAVPR